MKNWNKIRYGKAVFLALFAVIIFLNPIRYGLTDIGLILSVTVGAIFGWTIFGTLIVLVVVKVFNGTTKKPSWNESPLKLSEPLIAMQFIGTGAIVFGLANIAGILANNTDISIFGLQNLCTGIGVLMSMKVSQRLITGTSIR